MRPIALLSALLLLALTACAAPPPEESSEPEPSPALSLDLETLERTMSEDRYAALTGFLPVLEEDAPLSLVRGEAEAPEDTTVAGYLDFFRRSWDGEGEAPLAVDYVMAEDLTGDGALAVEELGSQVDGICTIAGETVSQAEFDQWLAEQEGYVPRYTGTLWTSY